MPFRARKRVRLWPLPIYLNLSKTDGSKTKASWSFKAGPVSRNSRAKRWRVDLPGPFHWEQAPKPRQRKLRQVRPTAEKYQQQVRRELRGNRDLRPAANSLSILGMACTVAFLTFGAGWWIGLLGALLAIGGLAAHVRHIRNERAQGRRGLAFLPEPGTGRWERPEPWANRSQREAPHSPTCRARSAATCRCPDRKRSAKWGEQFREQVDRKVER